MKKIIVSIIVLCLILSSINIVNASTGTVNLIANKSVKPGETFTVTLSVSCEDGINGVDTKYNYDHDKLELLSANVANNNWANLGTDNSITIISNSSSKVTSSDVYVLTFKVKDDATSGTAKVSTSDIMIDSDLAENSSFNVKAKSIDINIITDNNPGGNNPGGNNPGDNNPGGNNPGDNNPGGNNPGDNNPGGNNPGDNNPGDNNPGGNNSGNNNQGNNNSGNNNQGNNNSGNNNQGNNNSGNNNSGNNNQGNNNSGNGNSGNNNQNSNNGNIEKNDNTTVTDTKLPKTGDVNFVLVTSIVIAVVSAIGFFIKAKSIS